MAFDPKTAVMDFDPTSAEEDVAIQPKKKSYGQGLKEWATTPLDLSSTKQQMLSNVAAPTVLGGDQPGSVRDILGGIPERASRFTLGTLGSGADIAGQAIGSVLGGVNALGGGIPGNIASGVGQAYMQTPMAKGLGSLGGKFAGTGAGKAIYNEMTPPTDPAALANYNATVSGAKGVATFAPVPGAAAIKSVSKTIAAPIEKGLIKAGEVAIRPKAGSYVEKAREAVREKLGGNFTQQKAKFAKIVTDEDLQGKLGNPEKLRAAAKEKADKYTGVAFNAAVEAANKTPGLVVGNPVAAMVKDIEEGIVSGRIKGDIATNRRALKAIVKDMSDPVRNYNKDVTQEQLFHFKRDLNTNFKKSADPHEAAKNKIAREAYTSVDHMITDPTAQTYLKKASNLYSVSDVLKGQRKSYAGIIGTAGTIASGAGLVNIIPGTRIPVLGALAAAAPVAAYKSGLAGQTLTGLARLGAKKPVVPPSTSYAGQQAYRAANMNPSTIGMVVNPAGGRGYLTANVPAAGSPIVASQLSQWKKGVKKSNKKGGK